MLARPDLAPPPGQHELRSREAAYDVAPVLQGVVAEFQKGLAKGDETFIELKRQILVRLLYRTAYYDGGMVRLVPDIYGWDDPIAAKLGLGAVPPRRKPSGRLGVDVGP